MYMNNIEFSGEERRKNYITLEARFNQQDILLSELKDMIVNHIGDEKDLIPVVKDLVKAWEAANWLLSVVKWIGIIAGSLLGFIALLKGSKS